MRKVLLGALALSATVLGANAYAGNNVEFTIHNSSSYIISAFQTNDGDGWSNNWLGGDQVDAGEKADLKFVADGPCDIQLRVSWRTTDGGQQVGEPWDINICDAKDVFFDGKKVTYK